MASGQQTINLDSLTTQQLSQVKKQLDEEVEHLTSSYTQLAAAHGKFKECLSCVQTQAGSKEKKQVLVPLTSSLYVPGVLSDPGRVLVDIGTGFYVDKDVKSAEKFYDGKIKELTGNIQALEGIVQAKSTNLRTVEEVLRQKMLAQPQPQPQS